MANKLQQVAVIGCGVMGRGIAGFLRSVASQVWLYDTRSDAARQAQQALLAQAGSEELASLQLAHSYADLADCDLVIEAIAEDLPLKQALLSELENRLGADCVIASNTSSLSITALASSCQRSERVLGLHFFNPVKQMRLIELIPALQTEARYLNLVKSWLVDSSHTVLQAADNPGFIVNHAGRGYGLEALRIWQEQVAEPWQIDLIMRRAGFKLGPFELLDLVGLDVSLPVMQAIYTQYYHEARYQPSVLLAKRLQAGWLGRKSGRGFYHYDQQGKKIAAESASEPSQAGATDWSRPIWFDASDAAARRYVPALLLRAGISADLIEQGAQASAQALILLTPQGEDCSSMVARLGLDGSRCLAVDSWLEPDQAVVLMRNPASSGALAKEWLAYLKSRALPVFLIQDSAGLVFQRIIANIINIAAEMAQQAIASPAAIDQAVLLGLAYPHGPLAWGDRLGLAGLLKVLKNLQNCTGESRYRASLWLQRRTQLQLSLLHDQTLIY